MSLLLSFLFRFSGSRGTLYFSAEQLAGTSGVYLCEILRLLSFYYGQILMDTYNKYRLMQVELTFSLTPVVFLLLVPRQRWG